MRRLIHIKIKKRIPSGATNNFSATNFWFIDINGKTGFGWYPSMSDSILDECRRLLVNFDYD